MACFFILGRKSLKKVIAVSLLSSVLSACSSDKTEDSKEGSKSSVIKVDDSSLKSEEKKITSSQLEFAKEFMTHYIEQSFDQEKLKEKETLLEKYRGDSSLDVAIQEVIYLKEEVEEYKKTNKIENMASVTLIERKIGNVTIYQNGALYFADVSYSESSPAFSGKFARRRQYTFKIEDGKINQFEEVIYK